MTLVLDSSATLAWYFEDERSDDALAILDRVVQGGATVPVLWRLEVASGLQAALRRGRITEADRDASIEELLALPVTTDFETNDHAWATILALSDRYRLTPYDAAYLELALRKRLPLATFDAALIRAALVERVPVLPSVA